MYVKNGSPWNGVSLYTCKHTQKGERGAPRSLKHTQAPDTMTKLTEGTRVRVTRHTSKQINSSEGVVTGEESFEGTVTSADEYGAMVKAESGKMQRVGTHAGTEHGYPTKEVEIIS
jgi:hypothetical protein